MKMLVVAVLCSMVAIATCKPSGLVAPYVAAVDGGAVVKGPSSSTTVVGPDGSSISSVADTGAVEVGPKSALVPAALSAHVVAAPAIAPAHVAYAAPAHVSYAAPAVYAHAPVVPAVAPAPVGTIIDGPSGRVATSGSAVGYIAAPVAPGVVAVRSGW